MKGTLSFENNKWKISFNNEKGDSKTLFCQPEVFSQGFAPDKQETTEIEFERDNTPQKNACKIRLLGEEWKGQERVTAPIYARQNPFPLQHPRPGGQNRQKFQAQQRDSPIPKLEGDFHNPYNFVTAKPRREITGELADRKPTGHDKFHKERYAGKLTVKMTVETPLVVLDTARVEIRNDHKKFPVRVGGDGKPFINPTAVKGMLRSAYEIITNSRLSVFTKHDDRLAFRREAKSPIPVRIEEKDGIFSAKPLEYQKIDNKVMNGVAKIIRYEKSSREIDKGKNRVALRYSNSNEFPEHGDPVFVKYRKIKAGVEVFEIIKRAKTEKSHGDWVAGWACITGANISGKRFERVFLDMPNVPSISVDKNLWEELIRNYQEIHKKDLEKRSQDNQSPNAYLGNNPGQTAWSRHIHKESDLTLKHGMLCYAEIINGTIKSIFPVMISRQLFESSPADLLDDLLKPASDIDKLSPADRVFGCVIQNSKNKRKAGAYRGQIRIGSISLSEKSAQKSIDEVIHKFDGKTTANNGLPLNILGQPKPQQGRFYVAENEQGEAQKFQRNNENAGYNKSQNRGLRGRKVYPHHRNLPADYWFTEKNIDFSDRNNISSGSQFREYLRPPDPREPGKQRNNQNRSIEGWITPKTEFEFEINFTNLSKTELGALVWLVELNGANEHKYFHRFGGGKPLGFGSVKLELTKYQINTKSELVDYYKSLDSSLTEVDRNIDAETFSDEVKDHIKTFMEDIDRAGLQEIINSFLKSSEGFEKPIHYPRLDPQPNSEGKNFEWFVDNTRGSKMALPDLLKDEGLPRKP